MRAQVGGWQASAKAAVSSAAGVAAAKVEGGGSGGCGVGGCGGAGRGEDQDGAGDEMEVFPRGGKDGAAEGAGGDAEGEIVDAPDLPGEDGGGAGVGAVGSGSEERGQAGVLAAGEVGVVGLSVGRGFEAVALVEAGGAEGLAGDGVAVVEAGEVAVVGAKEGDPGEGLDGFGGTGNVKEQADPGELRGSRPEIEGGDVPGEGGAAGQGAASVGPLLLELGEDAVANPEIGRGEGADELCLDGVSLFGARGGGGLGVGA